MNTRLTTLCAALLAAGLASPAAQAVTAPLVADTSTAASNAGGLPTVAVSTSVKGLVKFDLSPLPDGTASTDIAKATLVFFVKSAATPGKVQVSPVVNPGGGWSEALAPSPVPTAGSPTKLSGTISQAGTYYTVDVTEAVQDWVTTPANNLGLVIEPETATSTSITFESKDSSLTSHHAYLEISLKSGGDGTVTSVTGSAPISVATGTTTPAISIAQATSNTDGFLSSADWVSFNSKLSANGDGSALTGLTGSQISGNIAGNAGTATALAANGTNCAAGEYAQGVDASGNAEGCTTAAGGSGTVTSVATGTGLTGGPITNTGTISLANTTVTAGTYSYPTITVNQQGQIISAASGTAVTSVSASGPLSSTGGATPNISLGTVPVSSGGTGNVSLQAGAYLVGQGTGAIATTTTIPNTAITGLGSLATLSTVGSAQIVDGSITGSDIGTSTVTSSNLTNTGVTAGTYTNANITVDGSGRVTAASSGAGGGGNATSIQGVGVANTAPTSGQVLTYNGTNWVPGGNSAIVRDGNGVALGTMVSTTNLVVTVRTTTGYLIVIRPNGTFASAQIYWNSATCNSGSAYFNTTSNMFAKSLVFSQALNSFMTPDPAMTTSGYNAPTSVSVTHFENPTCGANATTTNSVKVVPITAAAAGLPTATGNPLTIPLPLQLP